jgi:pimeloyl-ACP methyl ester carboxylesterase
MQVRTSDGVTLALHYLGGSGPPLLMAHATGFHGRVFGPLARHLSASFSCYALDERGHGDSGRPEDGTFEWDEFGLDVVACAERLAPDGTLFGLGHSCGGAALLLAELARPNTFRALYCYEPIVLPPGFAPEGGDNPLSAAARRRRYRFASRREALQNYASKPPFDALDPAVLEAYVEHGLRELPEGGVALKCRPEDEATIYAMGPRHQAYSLLGRVGCPVTVAFGERTDSIGADLVAQLVGRLPHGRAEQLPGLGHFGPLEDPAAVAVSAASALLSYPGR